MSKTDIEVWDTSYEIDQVEVGKRKVTEVLVTSPDAILHFKISVSPAGRVRLETQVKAMAKSWWGDRHVKLRRDEIYRRMEIRANQHRAGKITMRPIRDFQHLLKHYDIDDLVKQDEKARAAMLTAMGHSSGLTLQEIMDKAVETTRAQRDVALRERAVEKAKTDQDWGMF